MGFMNSMKSTLNEDFNESYREREGCVFRNTDKNISFKCINPNFLIKNNE